MKKAISPDETAAIRMQLITPLLEPSLDPQSIIVNAPVFWHGIALLKCHRTAHFSVWKTSGASVI